MSAYFVTGTDTDVGKTVAAAWLCHHLGAAYWKPVQSGIVDGSDADHLSAWLGPEVVAAPSTYRLRAPLSPHEAAARDGVEIALDPIIAALPAPRPLVVEGAGGVLVPLNDSQLMIDLIARLGLPAVVVARSTLGTINHSLLTFEALRRRGIPIAGVILNGPPAAHNRRALAEYGRVPIIAELPPFERLSPAAFAQIRPEIDLVEP